MPNSVDPLPDPPQPMPDAMGSVASQVAAPSAAGGGDAAPPDAAGSSVESGSQSEHLGLQTELTAAVRILPPVVDRDRTLLIALGLVLLLHAGFAAGTLYRPAPSAGDAARDQEQERRGQVEVSETITVELVEEPDGASKSKLSQIGEDAAPAPEAEPQPVPPTPAVEAQEVPPEQKEPAKEQPKPAERQERAKQELPKRTPPPDAVPELSPDDFDTTMTAYAEAVERAQAERRRQADPHSAEAQRIKGAAAQGKQSAYSKSVTTALARNKPKGYLTRGGVYVQFELTMTGTLRYVRVVQSSGDPLLDQTGVDSVKKTPFPVPPADVDPRDLRYTIHYVFN